MCRLAVVVGLGSRSPDGAVGAVRVGSHFFLLRRRHRPGAVGEDAAFSCFEFEEDGGAVACCSGFAAGEAAERARCWVVR